MRFPQGILTARGGMTSHAAVVARGMGTCCVAGCGALYIDEENKVTSAATTFKEGDIISIDGSTGNRSIWAASPPWKPSWRRVRHLHGWADEFRALKACAPTPTPPTTPPGPRVRRRGHRPDPHRAHVLRAERIPAVREMILSDTTEQRKKALAKLLPMQRATLRASSAP
jgi:pyruvate,orthophosphate dikinase